MKYKCLIFDHDDTVVNSTATIHYQAFVAYMKIHRPQIQMTVEEYFALNFDPGVIGLFRDICGLSEAEMKEEETFWCEYVKDHIPDVYGGIKELMQEQKESGGYICVVSHSYSEYIRRDYRAGGLPEPDLIYGWDMEPALRKPNPYALFEIERQFGLQREDLLVIDDLKPGYDMAKAAGVDFAGAGWGYDVPQIEEFMRENCSRYFKTVGELKQFLA